MTDEEIRKEIRQILTVTEQRSVRYQRSIAKLLKEADQIAAETYRTGILPDLFSGKESLRTECQKYKWSYIEQDDGKVIEFLAGPGLYRSAEPGTINELNPEPPCKHPDQYPYYFPMKPDPDQQSE